VSARRDRARAARHHPLTKELLKMRLSIRPRALALLTPLILATGPALAHASTRTTAPSGSSVYPTLTRFYTGFERFSARDGGRRLGAQSHILRPFYATFGAWSRDVPAGPRLYAVRNSIYEAVHAEELEPVLAQEQRTATGLLAATSGAPRQDLLVLRTYFADEVQAGRSLSGLAAWGRTGFLRDEPAALDRLNAEIRRYPHLIDPEQQDDPFHVLEIALPGPQRRQLDPQIRIVTGNLKSLSNLTTQEVAFWEAGKPGFPL
jgi:hypothetical protein